jgi:uncharacterized membrane protein
MSKRKKLDSKKVRINLKSLQTESLQQLRDSIIATRKAQKEFLKNAHKIIIDREYPK